MLGLVSEQVVQVARRNGGVPVGPEAGLERATETRRAETSVKR
jgi:hypothetical protein